MAFTAMQRLTAKFLRDTYSVETINAPLDTGSTTSITYTHTLTGGTNPTQVIFKAPLSEKVEISWAAGLYTNPPTAGFVTCSIEVRLGQLYTSGFLILAASDAIAVQNTVVTTTPFEECQIGRSYILDETVLTAGETYNAYLMYKVSTGDTGIVARKSISASPILG